MKIFTQKTQPATDAAFGPNIEDTERLSAGLRRVVVVSLLNLVGIMLVCLIVQAMVNQAQEQRSTRSAVFGEVLSQRRSFASELYFGQSEAITQRLSIILDKLSDYRTTVGVCIQVERIGGVVEATECKGLSHVDGLDSEDIDLTIGNEALGRVRLWFKGTDSIFATLSPTLFLSMVTALIGALLVGWRIERRLRRTMLSPLLAEIERRGRDSAIASTVKMLAHDVRRPFTTLKMSVTMLQNTAGTPMHKEILEHVSREVSDSLRTVESMIRDILEVSDDRPIRAESQTIEPLLEPAIRDAAAAYAAKNVALRYALRNEREAVVDADKLRRVMTNLIDNALSAASEDGQVWIETSSAQVKGKHFVKVLIGNDGKTISPDDMQNIFKPFFTKGKKRGTGLGLAIAERYIRAHGGEITCTSSPEVGTEFVFTLPASKVCHLYQAKSLPSSTRAAAQAAIVPDTSIVSRAWRHRLTALKHRSPLRMLVIDDEPIYVEAIADMVSSDTLLSQVVSVRTARDYDEAVATWREFNPHIVICDVDLTDRARDGLDLCAQMRAEESDAFVCMHSNRISASDHKRALDAGGNAFLPKPMSLEHLISMASVHREKQIMVDFVSLIGRGEPL